MDKQTTNVCCNITRQDQVDATVCALQVNDYGYNTISDIVRQAEQKQVAEYLENKFATLREPEYGGAFWTIGKDGKPELVYITKIIYSAPAIIAFFSDGDKIVAKAQGSDNYDVEKGLMVILLKKLVGSTALSKLINDWTVYDSCVIRTRTLADVRKDHRK